MTNAWADPWVIATVGAIIGGIVTSPFFVYLGYVLSERKNRERVRSEQEVRQAEAALSILLIHELLKRAAVSIPLKASDVTSPSTQLTFSSSAPFKIVPFHVLVNANARIPPDLRGETNAAIALGGELDTLVSAAREGAEEMTRESSGSGPTWLDEHRPWKLEDAGRPEFVRLYDPVISKQQELVQVLDGVQPKLVALTKVLGP